MQRQSLGSPSRGGIILSKDTDDAVSKPKDDPKRRNSSPSLFISDDDECKPEKPLRRCHYQPEKYIHLIPILLLLCFVILYLSSHDPSSKELAQFNGFKHPEKIIDATDIDEIGRISKELKGSNKNEIFAIRSLRNLQEEIQEDEDDDGNNQTTTYSPHRKLGDF